MRILKFYEAGAIRLFPYRWYFFAIGIITFSAFVLFGSFGPPEFTLTAWSFAVLMLYPIVVAWSWGLFLVCLSFHPNWGSVRWRSRSTRGFGSVLLRMVSPSRTYAAIVLTFWFLFPVIGVVLMAIAFMK